MQAAFDLSGKTALVTGCNAGLGQAMAVALSSAGATVVGVNRSEARETQVRIEAAGGRFIDMRADLGEPGAVGPLMGQVLECAPRLDILVNNAGIIRRSDALSLTEADWDEVMALNLKSLFFLSQAVARRFIAQAGGTGHGDGACHGKVIHIASMLSFQGGVRVPSYTAAKCGVLGLTRAMANEWAPHGINVNAIAPGYMSTGGSAPQRNDEARQRAILDRIPAGRWGRPEDLAGAVVFLAAPASDYMHGHTLAVDGGWLAR